jgi:hypothetical protein
MKIKHSTSLIAALAVLGGAGYAMAGTTNTFDAAVSVLSPDQTGFIIGGQVAVNGVGTGALTLTRSNAVMSLTGSANSQLDSANNSNIPSLLTGVTSDAKIQSSLGFDRQITTSGALVGTGAVVARGEAIAALGSAGAASANTTTAGTRASSQGDAGGEGNATANATSQGSLNGSLSTSNTLNLLGTSGLFAGSNGLTVGETNTALAYGSSGVTSDGTTGIKLNTASVGQDNLSGTGNGALFKIRTSLNDGTQNPVQTINMSVSNAGNGSISLSTSTGGFFTGGGAAAGSATFADTNSFFSKAVQP